MFDEHDPATWHTVPRDYTFRQVDPVTYEHHLFAPDGRNLSVQAGAEEMPPCPPETAVNAVIVAALLEHPEHPGRDWPWADMTPRVVRWERRGDSVYCPRDVWVVEVQYSSQGYRAVYGVTADNIPQCYAD